MSLFIPTQNIKLLFVVSSDILLDVVKQKNGLLDKKFRMIVPPLFLPSQPPFSPRKFPQLLVTKARTKNVSAKKKTLLVGPSDRIGANYTPSAKHLVLKTIRKRRKRSVSRMPHIARLVYQYCQAKSNSQNPLNNQSTKVQLILSMPSRKLIITQGVPIFSLCIFSIAHQRE